MGIASENIGANPMAHGRTGGRGSRVSAVPERSYGKSKAYLRSISFAQRPDIAVELEREDGSVAVTLFDPKYKLVSEDSDGDGTPKKVDIDKMHAYRDAIRDAEGDRVVRHAATLYPGATTRYEDDLSALRAYPGQASLLESEVARLTASLISG